MITQLDLIVPLAKKGFPPKAISQRLKCHPYTVYDRLRKARLAGEDIPNFRKGAVVPPIGDVSNSITIPARLFNILLKEAERRNQTVTETAQRLLENGLLGTVQS